MKRFAVAMLGIVVAILWPGSSRADLISVDFQSSVTEVEGDPVVVFNSMSGVEPRAATADADFAAADVWNSASLSSHFLIAGSHDVNPSWSNLVNSTGAATPVRFSILGNVIGTDVVGFGENAVNSDGLFFDGQGDFLTLTSTQLAWEISGLQPGTPFKLFLNQLDVATWVGPQNRAMKGFIDSDGDGTAAEPYQMDFPGVLITGMVAADGIIRGTSQRAATNTLASTEPDWAGFQLVATPVPEPSTLLLVSLTTVGAGLAIRRRLAVQV